MMRRQVAKGHPGGASSNRRRSRSNRGLDARVGRILEPTPERSALMKRVRRVGTRPERFVRIVLSAIGARYRLNVDDLPGCPDIANKSRRKAVFVHGCFWHAHKNCPRSKIPHTNAEFWGRKFAANRARDRRKRSQLRSAGYDVLLVWECQLADQRALERKLAAFWYP
jgi:DNA mismatch endonuclease, patch repair protein